MKKRICIVPFTKKEWALVHCLPQSYSIGALVSPKGIGMAGEDISAIKNTGDTGYRFMNSFEDGYQNSEVVVISEVSKKDDSLYSFALRALEAAITAKKEIICFLQLEANELESSEMKCADKGIPCRFVRKKALTYSQPSTGDIFHKFHIPVIYIGESIHDCEGYDIFLKLAERLSATGKRVLAISQDLYNAFMGLHQVQFWPEMEPAKLVYALNDHIYKLVSDELPEIILIRFPEPMIKYDDDTPFDFGVTAFMISQAVPGDACICCTYSGTPTMGFWDNINENFKSKFGYPIIGVHLSNQIIDATEEFGLSTIHVPVPQIKEELKNLNHNNSLPFYHLESNEDFDEFFGVIENEFFDVPYGVIEL